MSSISRSSILPKCGVSPSGRTMRFLAPRARAIDTEATYPQDIFDVFREAGLLGLVILRNVNKTSC